MLPISVCVSEVGTKSPGYHITGSFDFCPVICHRYRSGPPRLCPNHRVPNHRDTGTVWSCAWTSRLSASHYLSETSIALLAKLFLRSDCLFNCLYLYHIPEVWLIAPQAKILLSKLLGCRATLHSMAQKYPEVVHVLLHVSHLNHIWTET